MTTLETEHRLSVLDSFSARSGGLILRSPDEKIAESLADAAVSAPLHRDGWSPFDSPWNAHDPATVRRIITTGHKYIRERYIPGEWILPLAIIDENDDQVLGMVELCSLREHSSNEAKGSWWVSGTRQGKGVCTLALRMFLGVGFLHLGLTRVVTSVRYDNIPSIRVTEKLGFQDTHSTMHDFADGPAEKRHFILTREMWESSDMRLTPESNGVEELREYLGIP